jgi:hypothetical protein
MSDMDEQVDLARRVVEALESMFIPYTVGGSIALNVWAVPRMTHDMDISVDLPQERIAEFCSYFPPERYYIDPDAMRSAFLHQDDTNLGMYSFHDMDTGFKVDLFPLRSNDQAQQTALARRVRVSILGDLKAYACAPDDLLVQKLRWYVATGSERQFRDCLNLLLTDLKRSTPMIEWDYVKNWVAQLGSEVQQAWEVVKEATEEAVRREGGAI